MPNQQQPEFNETFLRKRSAQIVLEKVENATIFDKEKEMLIPRFKMPGKYFPGVPTTTMMSSLIQEDSSDCLLAKTFLH